MMQVQIADAEFYPVVVNTHPAARTERHTKPGRAVRLSRTRRTALRVCVLVLCGVLLALLAARVCLWTKRRQKTELLALVNPWNRVDYAGFTPRLVDIGDGRQVDERCAEALEQMLADCAAAGNDPLVCSAYRTRETQEILYQNKVQRLTAAGVDAGEADSIAAMEVARPGTSEHELGLAVDVVDAGHQALDQSQESTATQKWLLENCWQYGFILRYPKGSTDVTGVLYEPWHYRYVGPEAAGQIHQLDVTLEEYLTMFYGKAVVRFES